ncbi:16S rRNA (guanine(966)-N(2))-methyltransferase RsmD [Fusibacter paucivorans]|uniref:16S rRNA (Guanine(966)-N(2))-methyltransferase RsmD n=1 Tax=Fusibacter paucivorans TaxID=76009 RepID=A0ABS5PQM8_9FIRM|nr:16S rRNA (guanine(966)-N(2))-methyltransferase RsmD [Fusibacter paucivorans]MBS7527454.1 16S rRNA (guanine(966)-N(2))-methyltransferase RsmD [Fusibacter paucivorans]
MRVISGKARGTKLMTIEGTATRPTTDRVKEAIFSMVQQHLYEAEGLDLFAGSGALGIELLSRGGSAVSFIESSAKAVQCIRDNMQKTHLEAQGEILQMTVERDLTMLKGRSFDIVFMDPPYHKGMIKSTIETILRYELLRINGIIVLEHHVDDKDSEIVSDALEVLTQKRYGITGVGVYRRIE